MTLNKIHYFELASNINISKSSQNGNKEAYFIHNFLYHERKYVKINIGKAINYYKKASSFYKINGPKC